ncbi:LEA type 2 family protein [Deinococcus sp. AJ005]|uniref:LEA type 2 family protein n=1 Tax=Deinococcus sp. AJ005 TaxID=2652443 RepID=UPI00125CCB5A|nr:LEA type 2 family protein [Deinococcus sp. AJ005]QFP76507.1 Water stress and hypersensitive response domain-containing protein [Deinococcus sp. AJ005]
MRLLLPAALAACGLAACAPVPQALQVPTIEVQSVRLTRLSLPGGLGGAPVADVKLKLRVTNPNAVPLKMSNIEAKLVIDGAQVGQAEFPRVNVPARGSADQDADVSLPVTLSTAASFLKVARGQQVTYRLDGTFTADFGPLGPKNFGPFTLSQGQWKQNPIIPF